MRCTCKQAAREARKAAFEEAARLCADAAIRFGERGKQMDSDTDRDRLFARARTAATLGEDIRALDARVRTEHSAMGQGRTRRVRPGNWRHRRTRGRNLMAKRTIKERRERGLNDLARVIVHMWGERCRRHDGHCRCCVAWTIFDAMEDLTDSTVLLDE